MSEKFEVNGWMMSLVALLVAGSLGLNVHFLRGIADRNTSDIQENRTAIAEGIKWMQTHTQEAEKRITALEVKVETLD